MGNDIYRHILDASFDAVVAINSGEDVLEWNLRAEAIFGWSAQEAIGAPISTLIVPERFRSQFHLGLDHLLATGEGPLIGKRIELTGVRKDGSEIPVEFSVTPVRNEDGLIFIAFVRDISIQMRGKKRLEAQNNILRILSESTSMRAAEKKILNAMLGMESWRYGGFWRRDRDKLHCAAVQTKSGIDLSRFLVKTWTSILGRGEGFPGRIWEIERPEWIADFQDTNFIRTSEAARIGLNSAFGFPIFLLNEVYGIFEFFGTGDLNVDASLIDAVNTVSAQIGFFLERKVTEAALKESEERFRSLADSAPALILILDAEGRNIYVNRPWTEFTGRQKESALQTDWTENVHPEDKAAALSQFQMALAEKSSFTLEFRLRNVRGEYHWMLNKGTPRSSATGEFLGFIAACVDIDIRKKAQEEILQREKRFRALIENSNDAISIFDRRGAHLYTSASVKKVLGYTEAEFIALPPVAIVHPEDFEKTRAKMTELLRHPGERFTIEIRFLHKDGSWRWIESSVVNLIGEPLIGGILANFRDITKQKQANAEREFLVAKLERERTRLSGILDFMPVPMLLLEPDSARVLFANKAAIELSGGRFPEFISKPAGGSPVFADAEGHGLSEPEMPDQRAAHGEKLTDFEMVWHPDSGNRSLLINSGLLPSRNGDPGTVVLIFQDVTHLKQVEGQLRQAQKMEAIGRLAGGIAHDFNNLLTSINGYSSMALEALAPEGQLREFLEEILKAGERATALTKQLLAYSRKQNMEPKLWNLNEIVRGLDGMLRRLIGEDVNMSTRLDPAAGTVKVDRGQVEQIVINLVLNARDAMPQGGNLSLETSNAIFDSAYEASHLESPAGSYVMLAVTDTGIDMTPEVKTHIFEPFFTTKDPGKGTGLGLSSVYGIVKQSGGNISVYSEEGQGTTFRIYFPLTVPDSPARTMANGENPESLRGQETILVVEDEESVRKFTIQSLQARGYTVLGAGNGRDALRLLDSASGPVQMVITDVVMPELSGPGLTERLHERRPDLPILYVSGYTEHSIAHRGLLASGDQFLQKPFTPIELAKKVRQILDQVAKPVKT